MISFSIIKKSQLEGALRLDAEFYCVSNQIKGNFVLGKDAIDFVQYGTSKELNEEQKGFPVLRLNEFDEFFITNPKKYCDKISEDVFKSLELKKGDVLICRTNGNPKLVGKSAIVVEDVNMAFASYLFRVRPKKEIISPESLVTFLNSKMGRNQIERFLMPSIQSNFSPAQFRAIKIPLLPPKAQQKINELVKDSYQLKNQSNKFYSQAESLLLEELGLADFKNEESLFTTVNSSEVKSVGRIDAEYYQAKYEKLISRIKDYRNGFDNLENLIEVSNKKIAVEPEKEYHYIELADVNENLGVIDKIQKIKGSELPSRARMKLQINDVIVSSVEGSMNKVALIDNDIGDLVGSTGFFILREKYFNPEVNLILLKSIIKELLKREAQGTILTAISASSLKRIVLPKLDNNIQKKIFELVKKSHEANKKAKELLEEAKQKVEQLIEK